MLFLGPGGVPPCSTVFHAVVSRSRPPFLKICDCGAVGVLLVRWLEGLRWGGEVVGVLFGDVCSVLYVVVIGVSVGALALKKLARTFLLSCQDVFAMVAACNSHRLLLLPVSHSPGKRYTAYLVENGFRQISRNEHLHVCGKHISAASLVSPQQPPGLGSTSYTVHVRACVHFQIMSDFGAVDVPVSRWCPSVLNTIFYVHLGVAQVSHVSQSLVCQGGGAVLVW